MARLQEVMVSHVKGVPRSSKKPMAWSDGSVVLDEQCFDREEAESELFEVVEVEMPVQCSALKCLLTRVRNDA